MSWLDEALARQQAQAAPTASDQRQNGADAVDLASMAEQSVRALDPLIEQTLTDYGERAIGRGLGSRNFRVQLEAPRSPQATPPLAASATAPSGQWTWHWHLHSFVRGKPGLEIHPIFDAHGVIIALDVRGGAWHETTAPDENALKQALVHAYTTLHVSKR